MIIIISIIIVLLSLVLFVILYDYYVHRKRSGQLIDLIPGPSHIPVFGSAHLFRCSRKDLWNLLRNYTDSNPIIKCWFGSVPVVFIRHPDDLKKVLSSSASVEKDKIIFYNILRPLFGDGLLTSRGSKWHTRRKILTPAFHFNILQQFCDVFIEESNCMVKSLKDVDGPVTKDLVLFLREHTLNIICETAMGISLDNFGTVKQSYIKLLKEFHHLAIYRFTSPWLYPDFMFALSSSGRKQAKLLKIVHEFSEQIIMERKICHERTDGQYLNNIESNRSVGTDDEEVIGRRKKRLALLDLLIATAQENYMTDLDIREEVDTFMAAGHDTTAMGLCFTLLLLAEHKDIQNRVRTEIDGVMKENKGQLTMTSLHKLPYLERCLKEALRLYPIVHSVFRVTSEDIKCQSYTVPANTLLYLNIYGVHRDPNFWPNPDIFDPDRFLPDHAQSRHPYSYLPFIAGSRNCIGQRFAMLEMKTIVASLVHNFYLEPVDYLKDLQLKLDVTLCPGHPVHIKFVSIK